MKDIKELRELSNYMLSDLSEGLLAGMDAAFAEADKYVDEEILKKWFVNDNCKITKKKNGYVLRGNFKTKDIGDTYNGPKIVAVYGNFAISDTKLSNLEGMFSDDCMIEGTFTIENNDNLVSLKGCPISVSTLVIANNKNLKDIDIAPNVLVNAYISKNGKKFKETQLRSKINVYKKIFCSIENEDKLVNESETINEAFKAPQLKLVADAIKRCTKKEIKRESRFTLELVSAIAWDKLEASKISEYDNSDPKTITVIRGLIYKKAFGMFALMNKEGEVYAIIYQKQVLNLSPNTNYRGIDKWTSGYKASNQDLIDSISNADSFMFIDLKNEDLVWDIRSDRRKAREGALIYRKGYERTGKGEYSWSSDNITAKNVRYYQDIADENRERYKTMLQQLKAKKALTSGNFDNIKKRLDAVFARYTTLLSKVYANPTKYSSWDLDWLNDKFYTSSHTKYSTHESGLFRSIEVYFNFLIEASKGSAYMGQNNDVAKKIKDLEETLLANLRAVEIKLDELERK
jgi:hypothetical protein